MMPERAVLGAILIDNSVIGELDLVSDDFFEETHRQVFTAMRSLSSKGDPLDAVTVSDWLKKTIGGQWLVYLGGLAQDCVSTANVRAYAGLVRDDSIKRRAMLIGHALVTGGDCDAAMRDLMQLTNTRTNYECSGFDAVNLAIERLEAVQAGGEPGIKTGLTDLDEKLGGFHESDLVVVAARAGMGKTAFMLNLANNCGVPCGIISAEMSREQLGQRLIALNGRVSAHRMRQGKLHDDEWTRVAGTPRTVSDKQIMINDQPAISVDEIARQARRMIHRQNIQILFVDYIQRLTSEGRSLREEIIHTVRGLKTLARELNMPVVALAQVKREVDTRPGNKRPFMGDIQESGAIEQEADQVLTLYRDEVYNLDTPDKGVLEIIVCKNRHGPTGTIRVAWQADYMLTRDLSHSGNYKQAKYRQ
jgi:replicative DNA helicase